MIFRDLFHDFLKAFVRFCTSFLRFCDNSKNPMLIRCNLQISMQVKNCIWRELGGGGGEGNSHILGYRMCQFLKPKTLTIRTKRFMMLDIILKNLSAEKNWKKYLKILLLSAFICEHFSKNL